MATEDTLRKRKSVRTAFTKTINSLMEEFEKEVPNGEVVKTKCLTLDRIYNELNDCDDIVLKNIGADEDFDKEYIKIEEYRENLDLIKIKNENFFNKIEEVVKFFNYTLSTDLDGRYMVKLPWTDNSSLPENKNLAEKRPLATTSKLISSGRYQQRLRNDLRKSFREEYLSLVVQQQINEVGSKQVEVGDVVLVVCDNKKRLDW
ncbi:hypothetical protein NPIL_301251 [Nephila pilipes]|uniref:DUF5641 domain-containing protein n=1 Tax=Nephila pilipes TaxID=299642 RepID=A0A8X6UFZ7_NEPPI|nr:hypothetical protein NPIL_301251 [Nephila pilipes]